MKKLLLSLFIAALCLSSCSAFKHEGCAGSCGEKSSCESCADCKKDDCGCPKCAAKSAESKKCEGCHKDTAGSCSHGK